MSFIQKMPDKSFNGRSHHHYNGGNICDALDTELRVSSMGNSMGKLKEGATLSASSGLLYKALTSRGKSLC